MNYLNKDDVDKILKSNCMFIETKDRKHWLELRKQGIGGSDVAGIFNESPWADKRKVWLSKQKDFVPDETTNEAIDFGNNMEDCIFNMFGFKFAKEYQVYNYKNILFRNYFNPHEQASVDGIIVRRSDKKVGILEIKTVQLSSLKHWKDGNVPKYYMYQGLHYMNTLELDFVVFFALVNVETKDGCMYFLKPITLERKDYLEELEIIRNEGLEFWTTHVQGNVEPGIKF